MEKKDNSDNTPICGIIMPISSIDGCSSEHWKDVFGILSQIISESNFIPNLVSSSDDAGIIQKRIIQNIYSNEMVICDVSGKNPNVMFELGMRLAFDKPTIIIKDDATGYSFDTSPIEHLEYPRDLRFNKINEFTINLKDKLKATYEKSIKDPKYTTFLKHFGEFKVTTLKEIEISSEKYLIEAIDDLKAEFGKQISRIYNKISLSEEETKRKSLDYIFRQQTIPNSSGLLKKTPNIQNFQLNDESPLPF